MTKAHRERDGDDSREDDRAAKHPSVRKRVEPTERLGLPTHFYKIIAHEQDNGFVAVLAILLPHTDDEMPKSSSFDEKIEWLTDHITTVDAVEKVTGCDFFPDMEDAKESTEDRAALGDCSLRAPTDPYVGALSHQLLRSRVRCVT